MKFMGGGPIFPGRAGSVPIQTSPLHRSDAPMEEEYVFPEFCPQTPPRLQPPPEIPLLVHVREPLSLTGSTTCRISLFSISLLSRSMFEKLGSSWEVPLMSPGKHRFSIQTTFTRFHFTCTVLREGEAIVEGDIGPTFVTETVSTNEEGFIVTLKRDRDTTLLRPSIKKCSAYDIFPPWRGSIQRALLHSEDGEAASPPNE